MTLTRPTHNIAKSRTSQKKCIQMDFAVLYGSADRFDAWNMFVWTFEDYKTSMLKCEIVIFRNLYIIYNI